MPGINLKPIKKLFRKVIRRDETWAIGIYTADSSLNLKPLTNVRNPVLTAKDVTDIKAEFVADPFMVHKNGTWYMFFEALNLSSDQGVIALATSVDGTCWTYQQVVLEEPFHLSYPYVFEWNQEYYLVPETCQVNEVRLYKASHFPNQWVFQKTLLQGADYVDSSLFFFNQRWWMFSSTTSDDILRLHHADHPLGDWVEHPKSPLITNNPRLARPAGRSLVSDNRLIRFAQDDQPIYGRQVRAFEIMELTPENYMEQEIYDGKPILEPNGSGWNSYGMHHIDLHNLDSGRWIACVDGRGKPIIRLFGLPAAG